MTTLRTFARAIAFSAIAATGLALAGPAAAQANDPQNTIYLETKHGRVVIRLRPDLAPKHVEQIKTLTRQKFYDGAPFHRVIPGFMAQTGDAKNRNGTGGSDLPNLPAEFTQTPYRRGTLGMARSQSPNSANSQFFICFTNQGCASLQGQYTVFGEVVSGMENIDKVKAGSASNNGSVSSPDSIVRMQLAVDAK